MQRNAEASSSRPSKLPVGRRKSQDALKRARNTSTAEDNEALSRITSPSAFSAKTAGSAGRRVTTVPPSAAYEPPTPPGSIHDPSPDSPSHVRSPTGGTTSTARRKRRTMHVKYDTSESSADTDDEEDDDPPWWTFTQRGMAKMKARSQRLPGEESDSRRFSGVESGRDSGKEKEPKSRASSRQNSKDKPSKGTPASSIRNHILGPPVVLRPSPNHSSHSLLWRRSAGRETPLPNISLEAPPPMIRASSAPSSPVRASADLPSPGMTTLVPDNEEGRSSGDHAFVSHPKGPTSTRRPIPLAKRQMTAPAFPRFRRKGDMPSEVQTDTEVQGVASPRLKHSVHRRSTGDDPATSGMEDTGGNSTPTQAKARRRQAARLKSNLTGEITQHFANGWPHAGSWQDAYYGYYNESPGGTRRPNPPSRKNSAAGIASSRRSSVPRDRLVTPHQSDASLPTSPTKASFTARRARKKSRRARRIHHAMAPPTPSGLGFTPQAHRAEHEAWKEGRVGAGADGFDWGHGNGIENGRAADANNEKHARSDTRGTGQHEKGGTVSTIRRGWRKHKADQKQRRRSEPMSWRTKARRMMFLDARVTIWIRLLNLTVVIVSLALAVRIRLQLDQLRLPGLIGSSTTLIIAYSTLTAVHVLLAIYREYFGKPIGLWGLRSKMLWVCLDLIFIALWSSAGSIATNDYIATPLQCTLDTPWWRGDLAQNYAKLVQAIQKDSSDGLLSVTPVDKITHSLGIILPVEITSSPVAKEICDKQAGSIALSLLTLLLYVGNMVLSLFRIFETVRRTANVDRAVMA